MPFDFNNDFLDNPALQYGMNLLGSRGTLNPYASAQTAMQKMREAQYQQQLQQMQALEQMAMAGKNVEETRKVKQVNDLLAEAIRQYQGGQAPQQQVNPFSAPTPQQEQGPEGTPGVPNGYNGQGQNVNPFNGFATPGQQQIGARPIQQQAPQIGGNPNEILPALDPMAFALSLGGLNEAAKLRQEAYGQKFLPNGMALGHTRGGGVANLPGSLQSQQENEEMRKSVERAHTQVEVPMGSSGKKAVMSGLEADMFYRTGQLPQRVIEQFGLQGQPVPQSAAPAPGNLPSSAQAYAPGGAPAALHQAVMSTESGGNPNAVSPVGARGLMQVMQGTNIAPGFGVTPARNNSAAERVRVGHDYLNAMHQRYGDPTLAAIAYNMGPAATDKWLAAGGDYSKLPAETKNYVSSVMTKAAVNGKIGTQAAQLTPTPAISTATPGVTQSPAEATQANEFAMQGAKQYMALKTTARQAQADLGNLQLLEAHLNKVGNTGLTSSSELGFYKIAQGMGFKIPSKANDLEAGQAMARQFALKLRNPAEGGGLPGQMSNYEDRLLQSMVPNIDKLPGANRILFNMVKRQKQRVVQQAQLAAQWKNQGVPLEEIDQRLIQYADEHPFFTKEDEAAIMGASGQGRSSISTGDKRGASGDWESGTSSNGVKFLGFK